MLGKFRIVRRIAEGGFADVYKAYDTVEGINVALKIPHPYLIAARALDDFLKEVRITARLDHPSILQLKNASFIGDDFVIVYPLGERTLDDRMSNRLSVRTVVHYTEQMLDALAFAHRKRVIHCDIKPANFIIFPQRPHQARGFRHRQAGLAGHHECVGFGDGRLRGAGAGAGQAVATLGRVFLGLIVYRMLTGHLPSWPFEWPLPGHDRLRRKVHPEFVQMLRKALEVDGRRRYPSAVQMLTAFKRVRGRIENPAVKRRKRARRAANSNGRDWRTIKLKEFRRTFAKQLEAHHHCGRCRGPISESMKCCPWCGNEPKTFRGTTRFPARCRVCRRGMKLGLALLPTLLQRRPGSPQHPVVFRRAVLGNLLVVQG